MSILCLGGGKMVDMPIEEGIELVEYAKELGIWMFDTHHRYGNCEEILSNFPNTYRIAKVSAYCKEDWFENVKNSFSLLRHVDVFFVSDFDDKTLYVKGEEYYEKLRNTNVAHNIGITSESPELVLKFKREHPECTLFMVPVYLGSGMTKEVISELQQQGRVASIKPFDDGRRLKTSSIKKCLQYQKDMEIDVVVFGTKSKEHLKEVVDIWRKL